MDLHDPFQSRLLSGERIKWSGRPKQGFLLTDRDLLLVPVIIFTLGFAIFWTNGVSMASAPWFFPLVGWAFVAVGAYLLAGRFAVDAWMRRDLRYAVTDRRVLIARPGPFPRFTAISLNPLPEIELKEHSDGRGTIRFGAKVPTWGNRQSLAAWSPAFDPQPQFIAIENPKQVFDLLQRAAER